jgi:hypothetical protein
MHVGAVWLGSKLKVSEDKTKNRKTFEQKSELH